MKLEPSSPTPGPLTSDSDSTKKGLAKSPLLFSPFLIVFIACIFIIDTMIIVYIYEGVVRNFGNSRFLHNRQITAELVVDITEGTVRALDYTYFMAAQGYLPVNNDIAGTAILQNFLVTTLEQAHDANGAEMLEFGFSNGEVDAGVYYYRGPNDSVLAVISSGELAGGVYTIFKPEMIGKNTSVSDYYVKDATYNLFTRPWYTVSTYVCVFLFIYVSIL